MTARLRDAVLETVEAKEQAILFLNRRGYTTTLTCLECGALQQCPDCSAPSMTYHLDRHRLVCHLCGHIENAPRRCLSCTSESLMHGQAGTERVEVAIAASMPRVSVLRLDRDSSRGRRLVDILDRFRAREADVLVGTQMLSKGHDFPGVTLVGILQGDHGLGLPDLRAAERTFQLLTQVAGRAGRGDRPGRVMVQAFAVDHPAIRLSATHDYEGFAIDELERRRPLRNPPHGHLALLRVQGPDAEAVRKRAEAVADRLKAVIRRINEQRGREDDGRWPVELLPPTPSPIERINRQIRWQMLLRARERPPLRFVLRGVQALLGGSGHGRSRTELRVDVDPQSLM
jgi:primosomal protein N' (replication factor Y)